MEYYKKLKTKLHALAGQMMDETVTVVSARPLSPQEAIGKRGAVLGRYHCSIADQRAVYLAGFLDIFHKPDTQVDNDLG